MAKLSGNVQFTGSLGSMSAYRMQGVDGIILRAKGGAAKSRIKTHRNFALTRMNNEEWKACIAAGKEIRSAMYALAPLADYNFTGPLHALCKSIQSDDRVNKKGRRSVLLSQSYYKLESFGLNKFNSFESILKYPLRYTINRDAGTAIVSLPEVMPGINLYNPLKQPYYRFVCMLAAVPDIVYDTDRKMYFPVTDELPAQVIAETDWHTWKEKTAAQEMRLSLNKWTPAQGVSLLLSAGVAFGMPASPDEIKLTKYAGAARILKIA